jgi:DNA polymerase-3 subunit epsilon
MKTIYDILERDLIFFDLETTGTDLKRDRIVEICAIKYKKNRGKEILHRYLNPETEIDPVAVEMHGLTNEFLKDYPSLSEVADEIYNFFKGCDLGGYNCINFDIPFLFEELSRCKKFLNVFNVNIIDSYNLLNKCEPRRLKDVYKNFFGVEFDNHHSAEADIEATVKVFEKQIDAYKLEDKSINDISSIIRTSANGELMVDISGWFKKKNGTYLFGRGKHKDKPVKENVSYLEWLVNESDIENNSKAVAKILLEKLK